MSSHTVFGSPHLIVSPGFFTGLAKRLLLSALLVLLVIVAYLGFLQWSGNFATVIDGELYRSAQPSPAQIRSYAERYGIRSIINLRGRNQGRDWYDQEVATATSLGIAHVDFGISARRELTREKVEQLIALMRDAPKPLLIHCNAGADRSGLASALYLAAIAGSTETVAEQQLSLYFGHLPLPFIAEQAMDRTFEALEPWLGFAFTAAGPQPRLSPYSTATSIQPE